MSTLPGRIEAVRRFSRLYTAQLGLLEEGLLDSPYSLTEARVIYELAHREGLAAADVAERLSLDQGYLSRVLRSLTRRGLVLKRRSDEDRRRMLLSLSDAGGDAFAELDQRSRSQVRALLAGHPVADQRRIVDAMDVVGRLLGEAPAPDGSAAYSLRPHRPGDLGWVVERHGALYAESHGWGARFEAACAKIAADFLRGFDPGWERSWIAERNGARVGSVFLVRRSKTVGQLRMLLVDPAARGLGIGRRLVSECVGHARHVGYRRMTLFTVRGLDSARRLYESEGFTLGRESRGTPWDPSCTEQRWDLVL